VIFAQPVDHLGRAAAGRQSRRTARQASKSRADPSSRATPWRTPRKFHANEPPAQAGRRSWLQMWFCMTAARRSGRRRRPGRPRASHEPRARHRGPRRAAGARRARLQALGYQSRQLRQGAIVAPPLQDAQGNWGQVGPRSRWRAAGRVGRVQPPAPVRRFAHRSAARTARPAENPGVPRHACGRGPRRVHRQRWVWLARARWKPGERDPCPRGDSTCWAWRAWQPGPWRRRSQTQASQRLVSRVSRSRGRVSAPAAASSALMSSLTSSLDHHAPSRALVPDPCPSPCDPACLSPCTAPDGSGQTDL